MVRPSRLVAGVVLAAALLLPATMAGAIDEPVTPSTPPADDQAANTTTTSSTTSTTSTTTTTPDASAVSAAPPQACDPNYAGACVPSGVGDVNCGDVEATDFTVVGTDVYNLDGDNDGIACVSESDTSSVVVDPVAAPTAGVLAATEQQTCDPNYSGACVPVGQGEVNCADVDGASFAVVGTDIYTLDQGGVPLVACESNPPSSGSTGAAAAPTSAATNGALASTGGSTAFGVPALVALLAGLVLVMIGGYFADPFNQRLKGGFTIVSTDARGEVSRIRIVSSNQRDRRSR
ncbi:hypothetical protein BH10ACT3_BH10ACT3_12110 [soil metagenome]